MYMCLHMARGMYVCLHMCMRCTSMSVPEWDALDKEHMLCIDNHVCLCPRPCHVMISMTYACICFFSKLFYTFMHVYVCVCMHACDLSCICVCLYAHSYVCLSVYVYVRMCVCMYACVYVCANVSMQCVCGCMFVFMYSWI